MLGATATALAARIALEGGRGRRLVAFALQRGRPTVLRHPPQDSRLYTRGRRRLETHLGVRADGSRVVVAVSVDSRRRCSVYQVGDARPWHDFERQAGLVGAAWGPCRDLSAGL